MKTMIAIILDRSGSMGGRESDVIQGVNAFIEDQRKLDDPACISLSRFDTEAIERFRQMCDLRAVERLTDMDYRPRGGTPLLDAVGRELEQLEQDWRRERPDRAIMVIVTDGLENSSRRFSKEQVKRMIQARQDSGKWAFIYMGANVDAFAEAQGLGIWASNTAGYTASARGMSAMYNSTSASVGNMRTTGVMDAHLGGNIDEDGKLDPFAVKPAHEPKLDPWTPPESASPSGEPWKEPA